MIGPHFPTQRAGFPVVALNEKAARQQGDLFFGRQLQQRQSHWNSLVKE
jgi:hypothetical protein